MALADEWKDKIAQADARRAREQAETLDLIERRRDYLQRAIDGTRHRIRVELRAFELSEEAAFIRSSLPPVRSRERRIAYETASRDGDLSLPAGVLVTHTVKLNTRNLNGIPHCRTFAFTHQGFTEFYHAYNLFGIPIPAGKGMFGNHLAVRSVSSAVFADTYADARRGWWSTVSVDGDKIRRADDPDWGISDFDAWRKLVRVSPDDQGDYGLATQIKQLFEHYIERR